MEDSDADLSQALAIYKDGLADLALTRKLPSMLGRRRLDSGIPILMEMLDHQDSIVRYSSAMALAFKFHYLPAVGRMKSMLVSDSDEDCRGAAAAGLGFLCQGTRDIDLLRLLGIAAVRDPDDEVRLSAYDALLDVNELTEEQLRTRLKGDRESVDRSQVKAVLDANGIDGEVIVG